MICSATGKLCPVFAGREMDMDMIKKNKGRRTFGLGDPPLMRITTVGANTCYPHDLTLGKINWEKQTCNLATLDV